MAKINHYIDKEEFLELLVEYQKNKSPIIYEKIGRNILNLVTGISHNPSFINYDENTKTDAISDSLFRMSRKIKTFVPSKSKNPLGIFETIA